MHKRKDTPPTATDGVSLAVKAAVDFESAMTVTRDAGATLRECQTPRKSAAPPTSAKPPMPHPPQKPTYLPPPQKIIKTNFDLFNEEEARYQMQKQNEECREKRAKGAVRIRLLLTLISIVISLVTSLLVNVLLLWLQHLP